MIKRKNFRKRSDYLKTNGVNIKCCYCKSKGNCKTQQYKEESENYGFKTFCTLTPNKTKKFLRKNKKEE